MRPPVRALTYGVIANARPRKIRRLGPGMTSDMAQTNHFDRSVVENQVELSTEGADLIENRLLKKSVLGVGRTLHDITAR